MSAATRATLPAGAGSAGIPACRIGGHADGGACLPRTGRARRGAGLLEALGAALVLFVILTATARLLAGAVGEQRHGMQYSQTQTSIREAMRRALRTIRHGYAVIGTSNQGTLNGLSSSATQCIVNVPDAGGAQIQIRIFVSGGNLCAQRSDQAAPGIALNNPIPSLPYSRGQFVSVGFNYYRTVSGVRSNVNATPATATEVEIVPTVLVGQVGTTSSGCVTLRNSIIAN